MPNEVFVLGAGASRAHGAPLSDELLPYALCVARVDSCGRKKLDVVCDFLESCFHVERTLLDQRVTERASLGESARDFPSLVDALSIVDTALDRRQSLTPEYPEERLREVRRCLEYCIYVALRESLSGSNPFKETTNATAKVAARAQSGAAVISFNYDVVIDIALAAQVQYHEHGELPIDYGIDFSNADDEPGLPQLLKLHGSFNWLHSRVSGRIYFGGLEKAIGVFFEERAQPDDTMYEFGDERLRDLEPVLITPTHLKDLRNPHLSAVWQRAQAVLRDAGEITFIGYSLPGDDLHVKYLLKRAIETRGTRAPHPRIRVVDFFPGDGKSWVQRSYENFFGAGNVDYWPHGFHEYAEQRL